MGPPRVIHSHLSLRERTPLGDRRRRGGRRTGDGTEIREVELVKHTNSEVGKIIMTI